MPEIFTSAHASTLIKPGHIRITLRVSDADPVSTPIITTPCIVNCIDCNCILIMYMPNQHSYSYICIHNLLACLFKLKCPLVLQQAPIKVDWSVISLVKDIFMLNCKHFPCIETTLGTCHIAPT